MQVFNICVRQEFPKHIQMILGMPVAVLHVLAEQGSVKPLLVYRMIKIYDSKITMYTVCVKRGDF